MAAVAFSAVASARPPLHTAIEVKRLTPDQAGQHIPVALRGVVTQVIPEWQAFTFQDRTEAVYVHTTEPLPPNLAAGHSVLVEGVTERADFAPAVRGVSIRVLGPSPMPDARRLSWEDVSAGRCDNEFVAGEGVVRAVAKIGPGQWSWKATALRMDLGGRFVWAYVRDAESLSTRQLIDGAVRVKGVCIVLSNNQRQFRGMILAVNGPADVSILQPGPANPFNAPEAGLEKLFQFSEGPLSRHRIKVNGSVTLQQGREIYIQDGSHGALVSADSPALKPGDVIEAVGFPSTNGFATVLEEALVRVKGRGPAPAPLDVPAERILSHLKAPSEIPAALLIRTSGRVLERSRSADDQLLLLNQGKTTFGAFLPESAGALHVEPGSRVAVTGVCTVRVDSQGMPRAFALLLRSPADVRVLNRPPWFSLRHLAQTAAFLIAFLGAAMIWVTLLRRRVGKQTEIIRQQFEREAVLQQRYRELVENASDLVYVRDIEGQLLEVNRGAEEMTGYARRELLARNILDLLAPDERARAKQELLAPSQRRGEHSSQWRFVTKDGREFFVETKERFLSGPAGEARVECIGRDVTARHLAENKALQERDSLERQLQHAQKLESVGQLAGGVAHDFNNLLTVITGYADMLIHDLPDNNVRARMMEILRAAERAAELTRQLLLFSRRQAPSPTTISVNDLLTELEKMLRRLIGEDIALTLELRARRPFIIADPGHIEQVVMNLAVNARDAMPHGGDLLIRTGDFHADERYAAANLDVSEGDYVLLEVIDTGTGIPPEVQPRIFEPFFTTKETGKGTGLGLSTVYGIVKQSQGAITVESAPGHTCFKILFPASESSERAAVENSPVTFRPGGAETILVAEDEVGVRRFVGEVLRNEGYRVLEAASGLEALRMAARHAREINLLLTDTVMPGMGGVRLAEEFGAAYPGIPVLHMSGYTDRRVNSFKAEEFLKKPLTRSVLLARVRERLDREQVPHKVGSTQHQSDAQ